MFNHPFEKALWELIEGKNLLEIIPTIKLIEETAKLNLKNKPNLLALNELDQSFVFHAIEKGGEEVATFFIDYFIKKSDDYIQALWTEDYQHKTVLHIAAQKGHISVVKKLLQNELSLGLALNQVDQFGMTPLHYAAEAGFIDIVSLLIANNANILLKANNGNNSLFLAILAGHVDIAKYLLQIDYVKFQIHEEDQNKNTALHLAAQKGLPEVVECLLQNGAKLTKVTVQGQTPFDIAVNAALAIKDEDKDIQNEASLVKIEKENYAKILWMFSEYGAFIGKVFDKNKIFEIMLHHLTSDNLIFLGSTATDEASDELLKKLMMLSKPLDIFNYFGKQIKTNSIFEHDSPERIAMNFKITAILEHSRLALTKKEIADLQKEEIFYFHQNLSQIHSLKSAILNKLKDPNFFKKIPKNHLLNLPKELQAEIQNAAIINQPTPTNNELKEIKIVEGNALTTKDIASKIYAQREIIFDIQQQLNAVNTALNALSERYYTYDARKLGRISLCCISSILAMCSIMSSVVSATIYQDEYNYWKNAQPDWSDTAEDIAEQASSAFNKMRSCYIATGVLAFASIILCISAAGIVVKNYANEKKHLLAAKFILNDFIHSLRSLGTKLGTNDYNNQLFLLSDQLDNVSSANEFPTLLASVKEYLNEILLSANAKLPSVTNFGIYAKDKPQTGSIIVSTQPKDKNQYTA